MFKPWGDGDRHIYRYHDGTRPRVADPLTVLNKLQRFPGVALQTDLNLINAAEAAQSMESGSAKDELIRRGQEAGERLTNAARSAFDIVPFDVDADGNVVGLAETEILAMLADFGAYVGGLADQARPLPSSPPPTGSAASDPSTTPPSSVSG